jgi:hypothetical protein
MFPTNHQIPKGGIMYTNNANARPFVGVHPERNPMVVIKFRTKRAVTIPSLAGKMEELEKFTSESEQGKSGSGKNNTIRPSQEYDKGSIVALIDELEQRGYMFTGTSHRILPRHTGNGRRSEIFRSYAFRFELPLHAKLLRGEKRDPVFQEIKGQLYTLLESLIHDRDMHAMKAYANPVVSDGKKTGLRWLSVNIVDRDAYFAQKPQNGKPKQNGRQDGKKKPSKRNAGLSAINSA